MNSETENSKKDPVIPVVGFRKCPICVRGFHGECLGGEYADPENKMKGVFLCDCGCEARKVNVKMDQCSYCGGALGVDRIESAGGGFRHYSRIDCCDCLLIQRKALELEVSALKSAWTSADAERLVAQAELASAKRIISEILKRIEEFKCSTKAEDCTARHFGYNLAIDDVLEILREPLKRKCDCEEGGRNGQHTQSCAILVVCNSCGCPHPAPECKPALHG